jgi:glycosyltransferase involved in cell wall biosynthesis
VLERAVAWFGRPIIFDFDDAIYRLHTSGANRLWARLKFPGKTAAICRLSEHVVVGNSALHEYAERYNKRVTVVPSSVDTERYVDRHIARRGHNKRLVIGWTGSSTSQTYLEMFAPVLRRLCMQLDVEIRVHSDRRPELGGVPFTWRRWSAETEVEELAQFDIGIMPMPDDVWAQGKCAMKALLYMAMGIPAVCARVGTNVEVIRHDENGLLAATADEWLECLSRLASDPGQRMRLGHAGRKTVEECYSAKVCGQRFAGVVREVCGADMPHSATPALRAWEYSLQAAPSQRQR